MREIAATEFESLGLSKNGAAALSQALRELRTPSSGARPEDVWRQIRELLIGDSEWRSAFPTHLRLFEALHEGRHARQGPLAAWTPDQNQIQDANVELLSRKIGMRTYVELHRWSVENREVFWAEMLSRLGIVFRTSPAKIADASNPKSPKWLPGAALNIAESCFRAEPTRTAIVSAGEEAPDLRGITYDELRRLSSRVANGLGAFGVARGERVAIYMPMTPESVAVYLGVILAGRCVVGIADTSAPPEFAKRAKIADAKAVFTIDAYRRDGKELRIYEKVVQAEGPPAVVFSSHGRDAAGLLRTQDRDWRQFLSDRDTFDPVPCRPDDATNILFSSGTTKDPKAIGWTHTTPIKAAADGYLHQDVHETDVLAWPTSFGWMMGPWLTYASLVNRATMALYVGAPTGRAFGRFVQDAGVTVLGVVPKLVRAWKESRVIEGLDWSRVRLFSSTAEPSTPEDMFYLMFLAGYKPIVEYCGGTEIGGGYLTGTVVQPCAPGTFTTPALGLDLAILDDGKPADRGEVFLIPPSIGLSNTILNYDNAKEYYEGTPSGPHGEILRRHGDRIERLPGGYYRHLGRIDDMININGVKTSSEEIREAIANDAVYDAKPIAVDVAGTGQASLVVYAVPRDAAKVKSEELRDALRKEFQLAIREKLNPLLAHVHDVVLVSELPQAGPGKTRTMTDLQRDYRTRTRTS